MSALDAHVEDYLRLRRALGYKMERHGVLLPKLVAYLDAAGRPPSPASLPSSGPAYPSAPDRTTGRLGSRSLGASPAT